MLRTDAMDLVSMVVLKERSDEVISRLLALGVFHPVDVRSIETRLEGLSVYQIDKEFAEWEAVYLRVRELLRKLHLSVLPVEASQCTFTTSSAKEHCADLEARLTPLAESRDDLLNELKDKESILTQIREYFPLPLKQSGLYTFLETAIGRIAEIALPSLERSLKDVPHVIYPFSRDAGGKMTVLVLGLRRDRALIDKVLKDLAWERVEYPSLEQGLSHDVQKQLKGQCDEIKGKIASVDAEIGELGTHHHERLSIIFSCAVLQKSVLEGKRYACTTEKTAILSGWVPQEEKLRLFAEVKAIDPSFYLEGKSADDLGIPKEEIPVRLKHSRLLQPFELLIDSYGLPRYGTIDPTIFTAISFLIMFGAMFGDIGHGFVLVLMGFLIARSDKPSVKQAAVLMRYCGMSAIVFGALFGSIFGVEFASVWIKPMHDIMTLFRLSIYFGMGMITLGIILNIINALRDRDYVKALFDKAGLIVGVIYWVAIAMVSKFLVEKTAPSPAYLGVIGMGLLLIFLRPVLELFLKRHHENLFLALSESMVEVLEIFMGYLANTVSFMRIAAYAITHTSLFMAIFELSRALKGAGFIVIILGNIIIILLEGLVSSIQSIRLNYYEFFSKFFVAGKHAYKPLTTGIPVAK